MENPFNSRSFSFLGVSGNHHNISHHGGAAAKHAAQQKINTFEVTQLAYLLDKLAKASRGRRRERAAQLDRAVHQRVRRRRRPLPLGSAHAGGGRAPAAAASPAATSAYPHKGSGGPANKTDMPMANLFISVQQAFGIDARTFGTDGSRPLRHGAAGRVA